jgi:biopolymer transport protein ExbD
MRFGRSRVPHEATFDLTPLIDVVLLLIIFFMLTAQFARMQLSAMDLPREKGLEAPKAGPAAVIIDLRRDGSMALMNNPMDMASIVREVQAEVGKAGPALDLTVRAERTCPALYLNQLADALAAIGVRNWKLATSGEGP